MFAFSDKIPYVIVFLVSRAVEHKYLVQRLKCKIAFVFFNRCFVCFSPFLRNKCIENACLNHLAFNLVTVLNKSHRELSLRLLCVGIEHFEDRIVLRLLPSIFKLVFALAVFLSDFVYVFDKERKRCLAAA